jgi:hypothetical protein
MSGFVEFLAGSRPGSASKRIDDWGLLQSFSPIRDFVTPGRHDEIKGSHAAAWNARQAADRGCAETSISWKQARASRKNSLAGVSGWW